MIKCRSESDHLFKYNMYNKLLVKVFNRVGCFDKNKLI